MAGYSVLCEGALLGVPCEKNLVLMPGCGVGWFLWASLQNSGLRMAQLDKAVLSGLQNL